MKKATIPPENLGSACKLETDMSLIERVIEVTAPRGLEEHQRLKIEFDKWGRRDAADALHADRIHRHTLIDDNPTSG